MYAEEPPRPRFVFPRKPKIDEHGYIVVVHDNVGWLDVIVGDTPFVEVSDCAGQLAEIRPGFVDRDPHGDHLREERHNDADVSYLQHYVNSRCGRWRNDKRLKLDDTRMRLVPQTTDNLHFAPEGVNALSCRLGSVSCCVFGSCRSLTGDPSR